MTGTDTIGVLVAIFLFLITAITSLIAWVFLDTRRELKNQLLETRTELRDQLTTNGRHLDSLVTTCWGLTWRADSIETFLEEQGYRPPRVPIPPAD